MNVLVTGGAGYVGSVSVQELLSRSHRVVVIDNLVTGHRGALSPGVEFVEGDCGDSNLVRQLVSRYQIDSAMHFAAETLVTKSMTDPRVYFQNNLSKGLSLLDALLDGGVKRIIFSSTAAVYGEPVETPITERHPTFPINSYGESKLMFERILDWYSRAYDFRYIAVRYFNAAGASENYGEHHHPETHLIPRLLDSVLHNEEFTIHGDDYPTPDGTCVRDYVHVRDIAQAHVLALEELAAGRPSGIFNIGSNSGYSVREVLEATRKITGHKLCPRIGPRRQGDPAVLVADNTKLKRELGWQPRFSSLEEIIRSAWVWKQSHPAGYGAAVHRDEPRTTSSQARQFGQPGQGSSR